jgi:voltage-gated potassium channel
MTAGDASRGRMFRRLLSHLGRDVPEAALDGLTAIGLLAIVLGTAPTFGASTHRALFVTVVVVWVCMAAALLIRLSFAAARREIAAYIASAEGLIDLAATLALPAGWLMARDPRDAPLFALIWAFRYMRDSRDIALFWRILQRSRVALLSIASLFVVIFLSAATLAYVFERNIQPDKFGSIPRAMWWAIVTLTTTGYGDVVPLTFWGRLLAGWVMVGGIVMFALQAGVIATALHEELRRRQFLHTWDLVMGVSFFQGLGAAATSDIVRLLQRRDVSQGTVIVRVGEPGDTMYFIVSGEATVVRGHKPVALGPGGFFGEMTLLFGTPRLADVIATKPSVLLVLDIADFRELAGRRPEIVTAIETEGKRRREENAALAGG